MTTVETEFPFTLPRGYVDADGVVHRDGVMRLASARDEIAPLADYRVQRNPGYHAVILLSRVITRLGDLPAVNPKVIEDLFAGDMTYLEDFYQRINETGASALEVTCPHCEEHFAVEVSGVGG